MKPLLMIFVVAALELQTNAVFKDIAFNFVGDEISQRLDASPSPTTCDCGRSRSADTRIINGTKTSLEGPFSSFVQVVNTTDQRIWCSGFIVTPLHVISAAHCVQMCDNNPSVLGIVAGNPYYEYRTGKTTKYTQKIDVARVYKADYTGQGNRANDIAVLMLAKPLEFNKMVSRACLPKESQDLGGEIGRIAGWGEINYDQEYIEDHITEGRVIILNAQKCHKYWQLIPADNPKQICVISLRSSQQRASQGDSGSPVLWFDDSIQRFVAVGMISYGLADRSFNYPKVNTKVAEFLPFINSVVER